jgi:hypothetical protein
VSAQRFLGALAAECATVGLNLLGVARAAEYDALVPPAYRLGGDGSRAAVVIGNGGGAFWSAYRAHADADPALASHPHPLDAFTTGVMERRILPLAARFGIVATLRLPFREYDPPLSFVHLAEAAGLGRRSAIAVLIHPEYGPWIALRGALVVDGLALVAPRPAAGFDPCPTCVERPCVTACPAAAVSVERGWDFGRCVDHRIARDADCRDRCEARVACVYGRAHGYPAAALVHHHHRAFAVMRRARLAGER